MALWPLALRQLVAAFFSLLCGMSPCLSAVGVGMRAIQGLEKGKEPIFKLLMKSVAETKLSTNNP